MSAVNRATFTQSLSVSLPVGAYGIAFGAASVAAGFSVLQSCLISLLTFSGASLLPVAGYNNLDFSIYGRTDVRKKITGSSVIGWGEFYTGFKTSVSVTGQFRFPPFGLIGLNYTRDEIDLGAAFSPITLNLIGPQLDISFNRNMFFSSILQYNDQLKNMNIFARFQWRFQPMSDFFIVFTDNFQTPDIKKKNRAIVLKLVYWFTP